MDHIQAVAVETIMAKTRPLVMSPAARKQMLWMLAAHIKERMGNKYDGLRSYVKVVKE